MSCLWKKNKQSITDMKKDKNKLSDENDYPLEEIWNTESTLARDIVPRLKAFKALNKHGGPQEVEDMKQWNDIIQKMIDAFELIKDDFYHTDEENKIINEGLDLFRKYFRNLWD